MKKFVLDTNIIKDLIEYHKTKKEKYNNGIDIKAVYDYLVNMKFDGISKCYVTIFSIYETIKDFKNFNEEFKIFKTILFPQLITSNNIRKYVDDFYIMDLDERGEKVQGKVLNDLRSLIAHVYSDAFANTFIIIPLILIRIYGYSMDKNNSARAKMVKMNLQQIQATIKNALNKELLEKLKKSKHEMVKMLNDYYVKIMALTFDCLIRKVEQSNKVSFKIINKSLTDILNIIKSKEHIEIKAQDFNIFNFLFKFYKRSFESKNKPQNDDVIINDFKAAIMEILDKSLIKTDNKLNDEVFKESIKKLFFRNLDNKNQSKKDGSYGFGFDINDFMDLWILMICKKGKYLKQDLPVLTADKNMKKIIFEYFPSSIFLYDKFYVKEKDRSLKSDN